MSSTQIRELSLDSSAVTWSVLSSQLEAFNQAWETLKTPPRLADYLPQEFPVLRHMTLIELIKIDLHHRWGQNSEPLRLEDYFNRFPELAGKAPADLIYEEYRVRRQHGQDCTAEDCLRRFPEQAPELARLFSGQQSEASTSLFSIRVPFAATELQPGQRVDEFDLLTQLGQGAFASVFLARQNSMQRLVALKISANRGQEAQTLAQLDHDHIVRVYDQRIVEERGLRLLYMQYIPGGTLQSVVESVRATPAAMRTGKLLLTAIDQTLEARGEIRPENSALRQRLLHTTWPEVACRIGLRLARALDYAHRMGVLHRDLKPANVLLTADGSPKLADFNISFSSKIEGATPAAYFGGSLAYMSPEQLEACNPRHDRKADSLDGRSDLYSLGVLLWELLTGVRPFASEPVGAAWSQTLSEMAARRHAGVDRQAITAFARHWPPGLESVLSQCLEPEPEKRFSSGAELAHQLEICLHPRTQQLLAPRSGSWRQIVRRYPVLSILLAACIPNLFAAVFNYHYNRLEIVAHLQDAQAVFWRVQAIINSVAFPVGLGSAVIASWPVVRAVRAHEQRREAGARSRAGEPAELLQLRRRCLQLGHIAAAISLTLWLLAAPAYPIALSVAVSEVPISVYLHFVASLAMCGLIAAAYPFFMTSCLAVCSFFPVLVPMGEMTDDDGDSLARLGLAGWFYLLLAASVPMLAVAALTGVGSDARFALGTLAVGGVVSFVAAFQMLRTLQADLAALISLTAPTDAANLTGDTLAKSRI